MQKTHPEKEKNCFEFIVNKKQVNKHKAIKTAVLYNTIELSAQNSVALYSDLLDRSPKSFELHFIQNAYLNDQLIVENQIKKLSNATLELSVRVFKKKSSKKEIICEALFGYTFKRAS